MYINDDNFKRININSDTTPNGELLKATKFESKNETDKHQKPTYQKH